MKDYEHLIKFEKILNEHEEKCQEIARILDFFEGHAKEFQALMDYYNSEQRDQDLKDDEAGLIPKELQRGVLSEDAIYDLYHDYRNESIRMLEVATRFLKGH